MRVNSVYVAIIIIDLPTNRWCHPRPKNCDEDDGTRVLWLQVVCRSFVRNSFVSEKMNAVYVLYSKRSNSSSAATNPSGSEIDIDRVKARFLAWSTSNAISQK